MIASSEKEKYFQAVTGHIAIVRKQGGENGGKVEQKCLKFILQISQIRV